MEETGKMVKQLGKLPVILSRKAISLSHHLTYSQPNFVASSSSAIEGTFEDLQDYARRLLASFPEPGTSGVRIKLPAESVSPVPQNVDALSRAWQDDDARRLEREREREEEGGLTGCREAVEILTRNPKKGRSCEGSSPRRLIYPRFSVI